VIRGLQESDAGLLLTPDEAGVNTPELLVTP
jgi:hypothetical protein